MAMQGVPKATRQGRLLSVLLAALPSNSSRVEMYESSRGVLVRLISWGFYNAEFNKTKIVKK